MPAAYQSESGTIGLRMPANETTLALIRRVGSPLATTSANISGRPSVSRFELLDTELLGRVGCALRDSVESLHSGVASTVIDCTGGGVRMVREGGIPFKDIAAQS